MLLSLINFIESLPVATRLVVLVLGWVVICAVFTTVWLEVDRLIEERNARARNRWRP